jgi:hypothetical protein
VTVSISSLILLYHSSSDEEEVVRVLVFFVDNGWKRRGGAGLRVLGGSKYCENDALTGPLRTSALVAGDIVVPGSLRIGSISSISGPGYWFGSVVGSSGFMSRSSSALLAAMASARGHGYGSSRIAATGGGTIGPGRGIGAGLDIDAIDGR